MDPDVEMFAQVMTIIMASIASLVVIALGGRVLWRWGSRTKPSEQVHSVVTDDRFRQLETAVDSIAIEVERISEAQRFMVGLLGEANQLKRGERGERAELPLPSQKSGRTNTPH